MRRAALIVAVWAAAAALSVPLSAAAQQDAPPGGPPAPLAPATDAWPGHALPDDEAARRGRAALPFTQEQIETLGRLLRDTQQATARGAGEPPAGRVRRIRLDGPGAAIPEIALRRGYTTAVSFADSTGAPWPIEEALVDRRFLPPGSDGARQEEGSASRHLLYLAPSAAWLAGNAVVKLSGLADPVAVSLRETGGDADFRVEIRLGIPGPNADPGTLAGPRSFHAGDPVLLDLLGGRIPPDAERLAVRGGGGGDRAWRRRGDLLLVTRAHLLSPGPFAAERGPDGRWAYRLADTPLALVSAEALGDRLAEAFAEFLHERTRKDLWGYAPNEALASDELIGERYRGIRPAPGYPACPDHSEKQTIFGMLEAEARTGLRLTESCAMWPASSVCGLYFSHPESTYFGVGKLGRDQVVDYARRKGDSVEDTEAWLAPNLAYDPDA